MLTYLPDYTALIQLLVGSVIISSFFDKEFSDPFERFRDDVKNSNYLNSFLSNYKIIDSQTAKESLRAVRKSLMLVSSIYGCMVLFYCASFPNEHSVSPCFIDYNGIKIAYRDDLTHPTPSPLGIALLSLITTLYQIYVIYKPSTRIQLKHPIFECGVILMLIVFAIFILFFPSINLNLTCFIGEQWKNVWESLWIVAVNYWVLFTLILWIGFHKRLYFASTKKHYSRLENRAKESQYKLDIYSKTQSLIGIRDRLDFISKETERIGQDSNKLKKYLIKQATEELKTDSNYYTIKFNQTTNTIDINIPSIEQSLKKIIISNKTLTQKQKKKLIRSIKTQTQLKIQQDISMVYSQLHNTIKKFDKLQQKSARELLNLGIIRHY